MKKILIIGSDGQLGSDLVRAFGVEALGITRQDLDITDANRVYTVFKSMKPSAVINAAGISSAQQCDNDADACMAVNTQGAYNVAKSAAAVGARVVSISSDYVFDGDKEFYEEGDVCKPLNVYGSSKLAAEHMVRIANPMRYIIRSSWFFGKQVSQKGYDFPRLMLRLAQEQSEVRVVNDQFGSPTYTKDLAYKIKELLADDYPYGVYHITNQGSCSWYEFAKQVFEFFDIKTPLVPISTRDSTSPIQRPRSSVLYNGKLVKLQKQLLRPWQDAFEEYAEEIQ